MGKLIRLDWAIKYILRDKANFDVLEGFLSELLGYNVTIVNFLESEGNQEDKDDKFNRVDILVKTNQDEFILIEVQNSDELDFLQRLLYGTSKLILEYMQRGAPYSDIKKVISVSIVYFDLGIGKDYIYKGSTQFRGIHTQDELLLSEEQSEAFNASVPSDLYPEYYLIREKEYDDRLVVCVDEWIYLLRHEEIKEGFKAKGIQAAKEKLDSLLLNKEQRISYKRWLENLHYRASMVESSFGQGKKVGFKDGKAVGFKDGKKVGFTDGKKVGEKNKAMEIARNLLDILDDSAIAARTGLTEEQVRTLR